ncbi:MAG: 4Fe-4S dicluster domain-containing protein [Bacteroidia bacterium]|nr:4Fe-4S dicluster domain-containing protein [Bacteroidia bacterium]
MNKLKRLRITLALFFWTAITLLFLDFTGTLHHWLGWSAKIQFIPALLSLQVVVLASLIILTLLFGRIYCSILCPLGIFQDLVSRLHTKKKRFRYTPPKTVLRYSLLGLFSFSLIAGMGSLAALLEPYSAYGRMVSSLLAPIYQWGNNLLAYLATQVNSYAFYSVDVWMKGIGTFVVALLSFLGVSILAWRGGRTYCNTLCPVGTLLGMLSRFSFYKIRIHTDTCNSCGLCASQCKASCIDSLTHTIDYTRCVTCFNCIDHCKKEAISYHRSFGKQPPKVEITVDKNSPTVNTERRTMLAVTGTLVGSSIIHAKSKQTDGGLAFIEEKQIPTRKTALVPAGALNQRHFAQHCTSCQLCVSVCPNQVLRPSAALSTFMQPEMSYERGYCRPECTRCSTVCPSGAILPITPADKSAIQIGHAVWIEKNCVVLTDGVECGNCAHHCPVGAITMIERASDKAGGPKIPIVNTERCIGCGACENLCPARPFSAIYVEGHPMHRII